MKINFSAYIKDESGNYTQKISGAKFPFACSDLLDERLDEAILQLQSCPVKSFEPTTEIKIEVYDKMTEKVGQTKKYYYIVSSDRAQELPIGSGKFKHEIHLIERTKLLEGIYCQSITFTNPSGNIYTLNVEKQTPELIQVDDGKPWQDNVPESFYESVYKFNNPIPSNLNFATPTPQIVANTIIEYLNGLSSANDAELLTSDGLVGDETLTGVYVDGISQTGTNATVLFGPQASNEIIYTLVIRNVSAIVYYKLRYLIAGVENRYPLKPWTISDCVDRCLDLAEPLFEGESPRYMLNPEQWNKYSEVFSPEFTMTQCTLREQLKVIGSFISAEPRLGGFDENGDYQENQIFFDEYGTGKHAKIETYPYVYRSYSHDINEYCTHIETSASNLVNALNYGEGTVTEPNKTNTRTVRTDNINVMLSDTNAYAKTDNKIQDIVAVKIKLFNADGTVNWEGDITPYIFEQHEYNNLSSYEGTYPYAKAYALYYTRGEQGIRGLFFKEESAYAQPFQRYAIVNILNALTGADYDDFITRNFARMSLQISYIPIYDTKFSHSKQTVKLGQKPFMRVYNQSENIIESRYYGENIKGVAQRLGRETQTRTYILHNLDDIPNKGEMIEDYFIVAVKTEFYFEHIKCTVELTKDFNRISQYVGISSNKRVYEVSESNAYTRDMLFKNYVVIGDSTDSDIAENENICIKSIAPIALIFNPDYNDEGGNTPMNNPVNAVATLCQNKSKTNTFAKVVLPVISSAFGNTMVFSWDYKDNYAAGEQVDYTTSTDEDDNEVTSWWQTDVACGDYYGRAYWYQFRLLTRPLDKGFEQALTVTNQGVSNENFILSPLYRCRKDSRERLSPNFEIEFVTTHDDIIIGSALASNCPLVTVNRNTQAPSVKFYRGRINKFSKRAEGLFLVSELQLTADMVTVTDNILTINFDIPENVKFDYWTIETPSKEVTKQYEDEDGNVANYATEQGSEILLSRDKSWYYYQSQPTETLKIQLAKTIFDR